MMIKSFEIAITHLSKHFCKDRSFFIYLGEGDRSIVLHDHSFVYKVCFLSTHSNSYRSDYLNRIIDNIRVNLRKKVSV